MLPSRDYSPDTNLYDFNAWDNAFLTKESHDSKLSILNTHTKGHLSYTNTPLHWDAFYKKHGNAFFKDRNWLTRIFPGMLHGHLLEVGCGVGNSLFNVQNATGCDFSKEAIDIARLRYPNLNFFVHDLTSTDALPMTDSILCVYCLSAIDRAFYKGILNKFYACLRPGGRVFFKDYGYMDLVQLRYKREQVVGDNFYMRGDGTYTYFFKLEEVRELATEAGFGIEMVREDRKLLVNRKRKLEMYRVMVEGVFVKK